MEDKNSNLEFSRISHLLRKFGLKADVANEITERITNMPMASTNVLNRIYNRAL
ncbi:MAG: hypothetical protein OXF84_02955 [Bacteroidetes bacterium]|nr:hypothetical protein [Bacteroidota bacterium]